MDFILKKPRYFLKDTLTHTKVNRINFPVRKEKAYAPAIYPVNTG